MQETYILYNPIICQRGGVMQTKSIMTVGMRHLNEHPPVKEEEQAKKRRDWLMFYEANGKDAALTCRHFGIPKSSFYRWLKRFDENDPNSLCNRSTRPRHIRNHTWNHIVLDRLVALRDRYPRWGKYKLRVLLLREGIDISASSIGRMIAYLKGRGILVEAWVKKKAGRRKQNRPHAKRKRKDYQVREPGDLLQFDTLEIEATPGHKLKHFTLIDVKSKVMCVELCAQARAVDARESLKKMLSRLPFKAKAIQVDNGSEFMGELELYCQEEDLPLFTLPVRSPKLNGCVERAQRTNSEEFYECAQTRYTLWDVQSQLRDWEVEYNNVRPHQTLGYLTPNEWLAAHNNLIQEGM